MYSALCTLHCVHDTQLRESSLVPVAYWVGFVTVSVLYEAFVLMGEKGGASLHCLPWGKGMFREACEAEEWTWHHLSFLPCKKCRETQHMLSDHDKGFINYVFCINWAVRNPAGDSSLVNKQVALNCHSVPIEPHVMTKVGPSIFLFLFAPWFQNIFQTICLTYFSMLDNFFLTHPPNHIGSDWSKVSNKYSKKY